MKQIARTKVLTPTTHNFKWFVRIEGTVDAPSAYVAKAIIDAIASNGLAQSLPGAERLHVNLRHRNPRKALRRAPAEPSDSQPKPSPITTRGTLRKNGGRQGNRFGKQGLPQHLIALMYDLWDNNPTMNPAERAKMIAKRVDITVPVVRRYLTAGGRRAPGRDYSWKRS